MADADVIYIACKFQGGEMEVAKPSSSEYKDNGSSLVNDLNAFDGGTPGIPNDSITMTLLDTVGGVAVGPFGGPLGFGRGATHPKDDIKIRSGIRGR